MFFSCDRICTRAPETARVGTKTVVCTRPLLIFPFPVKPFYRQGVPRARSKGVWARYKRKMETGDDLN